MHQLRERSWEKFWTFVLYKLNMKEGVPWAPIDFPDTKRPSNSSRSRWASWRADGCARPALAAF